MNFGDIAFILSTLNFLFLVILLWHTSSDGRYKSKTIDELNEMILRFDADRKEESSDVRNGLRYVHDRISKLTDSVDSRFYSLRHVSKIFNDVNDDLDVMNDIKWYKDKIADLESKLKDSKAARKPKGGKA